MITTGVTGRPWRASVSEHGAIVPWDDSSTLDWFVAADDRWHVPAAEATVRQQRVDGTAAVETRVRVPNGDVVQRVFSVADHGGLTVVEIENESTLPVAIAFSHRGVLTERPIVDMPIEGIELPDSAFVSPLGHRATIRVALAHDGRSQGPIPGGIPPPQQVVRGWLTLTERASRLVLPDGSAGQAESVTAERCELALGTIPHADEDPAGFVLALGELVRMGETPDHWLPELVDAVEAVGPTSGWDGDVALRAAARILAVGAERRARRDLVRIVARRTPARAPDSPPVGVRTIAWVEERLAAGPALLPRGMPTEWLGQSFDVYGIPTGPRSTVSYAIRWHGERPAVLWEQTGETMTLTAPIAAPGWSSDAISGEALWPAPRGAGPRVETQASADAPAPSDEPGSFS